MKAKLFLCADSAVVDARHTSVSAFQILDEVASAGFPFVIPRIAVVSTIVREPADPEHSSLQLTAQLEEEELFQSPFTVDFQGRNFSRSIAEVHNILIGSPGVLKIRLRSEGRLIAEWAMNIGLVTGPEGRADDALPKMAVAQPA
jgi:hypothetical protein